MLNLQSYFYNSLLLLILLVIPNLTYAEDGFATSDKIQGIWATPDCKNWDKLHYYTDNFVIKHEIGTEQLQIIPIHTVLTQEEYKVITIKGKKTPSRVLEDGVLQQIDVKENANFSKHWDDLPATNYYEYMHCFDTDLPKSLSKIIEISTRLDNLYPYCQYSISSECKKHIFTSYIDKKGIPVKIEGVKQIISDIALISKSTGGQWLSKSEISDISAILLSIIDTDNSKSISLDELQHSEDILEHHNLMNPTGHALKNTLKGIGDLFPSLK